jgi:hypothetical protein
MEQIDQNLRIECLRLAASVFTINNPYELLNTAWMLMRFVQGAETIQDLEGHVKIATVP